MHNVAFLASRDLGRRSMVANQILLRQCCIPAIPAMMVLFDAPSQRSIYQALPRRTHASALPTLGASGLCTVVLHVMITPGMICLGMYIEEERHGPGHGHGHGHGHGRGHAPHLINRSTRRRHSKQNTIRLKQSAIGLGPYLCRYVPT